MMIYDAQGMPLQLGAEVGQGGEAVVHQIMGRVGLIAKIYTGKPRAGYDHKLAWMLSHPPLDPTQEQGHASIAWPTELLYNDQRQFIGYAMPFIDEAVPLLEVFNPRLRAKKLPGFDTRYLYRTARNLAVTLKAIHAQGYVVGDINESNVLVTPSALVTIIDTDSFQVQEQDGSRLVIYPCPVGKPEYTSPELQGQSFQETTQRPEQDYFGLGILIFQLLMEGSHPFRAKWLRAGDPPPVEERIRQGCFPHVEKPTCPVSVPEGMLNLNSLHPKLAYLMRLCFMEGHSQPRKRPQPEVWVQALVDAERALTPCRQGHYYAGHLTSCPHCDLAQQRRQRAEIAKAKARTKPKRQSSTGRYPTYAPSRQAGRQRLPSSPAQPPRQTTPRPMMRPYVQGHKVMQPCPKCHQVNPDDEIYCQYCLHQLQPNRSCPYCRHETPQNARYCTNCGSPL